MVSLLPSVLAGPFLQLRSTYRGWSRVSSSVGEVWVAHFQVSKSTLPRSYPTTRGVVPKRTTLGGRGGESGAPRTDQCADETQGPRTHKRISLFTFTSIIMKHLNETYNLIM